MKIHRGFNKARIEVVEKQFNILEMEDATRMKKCEDEIYQERKLSHASSRMDEIRSSIRRKPQ